MGDMFIEHLVKARTSVKGWLLRFSGYFVIILSILSVFIIDIVGFVLIFLAIFLLYKIFQWTSIEYEYSYLSGELDIDKILGRYSRKKVTTIKLKEAEAIAPLNSDRIKQYSGSDVKVVDYSSRTANKNKYAIILITHGLKRKIIFEPNRVMIEAIKDTIPRKVFIEEI